MALESIVKALRPLRIYDLREGRKISAELAAYEAGFALVEQEIKSNEDNCCFQTMNRKGIDIWQSRTICRFAKDAPLETCRQVMQFLQGEADGCFCREGFEKLIVILDFQADFEEDIGTPAAFYGFNIYDFNVINQSRMSRTFEELTDLVTEMVFFL